jgi:hypothetical protein
MIRMGDIITTCRQIEVQDDATALPLFYRLLAGEDNEALWDAYARARKIVWRVESFRCGLSFFRPVVWALGIWDDFDTVTEAQAYLAELNASTVPVSLLETLQAWVQELQRSLRECRDHLWFSVRQLGVQRSSRGDVML